MMSNVVDMDFGFVVLDQTLDTLLVCDRHGRRPGDVEMFMDALNPHGERQWRAVSGENGVCDLGGPHGHWNLGGPRWHWNLVAV